MVALLRMGRCPHDRPALPLRNGTLARGQPAHVPEMVRPTLRRTARRLAHPPPRPRSLPQTPLFPRLHRARRRGHRLRQPSPLLPHLSPRNRDHPCRLPPDVKSRSHRSIRSQLPGIGPGQHVHAVQNLGRRWDSALTPVVQCTRNRHQRNPVRRRDLCTIRAVFHQTFHNNRPSAHLLQIFMRYANATTLWTLVKKSRNDRFCWAEFQFYPAKLNTQ